MKNSSDQLSNEELFASLANNIQAYIFENNAMNNDVGLRVVNQNLNKHRKIIGGLRSPAISAKSLERIAEEIEFMGLIEQTIAKNYEFCNYLYPQVNESSEQETLLKSMRELTHTQKNKLQAIKSSYLEIYDSAFGINNFRYLREICDGYRGSGKTYPFASEFIKQIINSEPHIINYKERGVNLSNVGFLLRV